MLTRSKGEGQIPLDGNVMIKAPKDKCTIVSDKSPIIGFDIVRDSGAAKHNRKARRLGNKQVSQDMGRANMIIQSALGKR